MGQAQRVAAANTHEMQIDQLFRSKRRGMIAYATAILGGDAPSAEDAVNEAFADIWRKGSDLSCIDNPAGWLRQIVRNKSIDHLRKSGRIELHGDDDLFDRQISPAPNPEENAQLHSERRRLRSALSDLNGYQREAIVMCYFEGLSLQEIAQQTGASLGTVKTRLFYARRILAETLTAERNPVL